MNPEETKHVIDTVNSSAVLIQEMNKNVTRLNTAVLGDDDAGIEGLAERVVNVEKKATKTENNMNKKVAYFYGIGAALSFIWGMLIAFKDKLFG